MKRFEVIKLLHDEFHDMNFRQVQKKPPTAI